MRPTHLLRVVFVAYVALVIALSLVPSGPPLPAGMSDKTGHFLAYAGLAVLGMPLVSSLLGRVLMLLGIVGLGAAMEGLQAIVPRRAASSADFLADVLGALVGLVIWLALRRAAQAFSRTDTS